MTLRLEPILVVPTTFTTTSLPERARTIGNFFFEDEGQLVSFEEMSADEMPRKHTNAPFRYDRHVIDDYVPSLWNPRSRHQVCLIVGMAPARMVPTHERRDIRERAAVTRRVIDAVVRKPGVLVSAETLRRSLNVPKDAAHRILAKLISSGLLREVSIGVYARTPSPVIPPIAGRDPDTPVG